MMRRLILLNVFFLTFISFSTGQQPSEELISGIIARSDGARIILTWQELTGGQANVAAFKVYRHSEPITADNIDNARFLGTVSPGSGQFEDSPPIADSNYFYAIFPIDLTGEEARFYIPYGNLSRNTVSVSYTATGLREAAVVMGLTPQAEGERIILRFSPDRDGRTLYIFRSSSPITNRRSLLDAVVMGIIRSSQRVYQDFPLVPRDYYYAVLDEVRLISGRYRLLPGENTTAFPVRVQQVGSLQSSQPNLPGLTVPLPELTMLGNYTELTTDDRAIQRIVPLEPGIRQIVDQLLQESGNETQLPGIDPALLPGEIEDDSSTELGRIVSQTLMQNDYARAQELLENYSFLPRSREQWLRLQFYMGQAYFFQEQYNQAFTAFLAAEEEFYPYTRPWLSNLYRLLLQN